MKIVLTDGLECVRRYREFEKSKVAADRSLVIIGMSANSNDTLLKEVLGVGMNAFIEKPFSIDQLERILVNKRLSIGRR
jgi:CheY-like chemotaxis protein